MVLLVFQMVVASMHAGMRPELLNERLLSLSSDTLAVVDLAAKGQGVSSPYQRSCSLL